MVAVTRLLNTLWRRLRNWLARHRRARLPQLDPFQARPGYLRLDNKWRTLKVYKPAFRLKDETVTSRRIFKKATSARSYAVRTHRRWVRLYLAGLRSAAR